jgi:hypothetical protein
MNEKSIKLVEENVTENLPELYLVKNFLDSSKAQFIWRTISWTLLKYKPSLQRHYPE